MHEREQSKYKFLRLLSAQIKIRQILAIFWNKSVFLEILHYSPVSWDITPLYIFSWNFICFQQKEPIKVQIWWNLTWAVESLKFCTLMGSFCPNHIKFQLNKVQKSYLSWHWRVLKSLKKNWLVVSTQKSKNFTSMGPFCSMYMRFDLNKCGGIIFHDSKNSEIWALMGYFCRAYVIFEVNKIEEFCREKWLMVSKMT